MNDTQGSRTTQGGAIIARAFRQSLVAVFAFVVLVGGWVVLVQFGGEQAPLTEDAALQGARVPRDLPAATPPGVLFTDVTDVAGIDFVHVNGAYGEKLLPETMGGGVAFLDYDADGDQDLLFVSSGHWPDLERERVPTLALYRNDGGGRFERVFTDSGLDTGIYGMGLAVGDYDADGWLDVFVTGVGENRLLRNDGGLFRDVTASAGVAGVADVWSTSAVFFDVDNDGDLDLFVANYVRWSRDIDLGVDFQLAGIGRAHGPPTVFAGSHPWLYRNDGDGTFSDISQASGVQVSNPATGEPMAKALAVRALDVDSDGHMDLFVANDTVRNFFLHNRGNGRFTERGIELGLAFDRNGAATGAMGVDAAYYRNDAELGLAVGNFAGEMTSLYVTQGSPELFADEAIIDGIGPVSRLALSFGLLFLDYDLDGRLDLFQANGHLEEEINTVQSSQHYAQPPQLFWNCGADCSATFQAVDVVGSGDLGRPMVGRGTAFADIDSDGDLDLVVTQVGQRAVLLRNDQSLAHHWVRLRLLGAAPNTAAIGARVELTAGGITQRRDVAPARSYLSQVELPVTFGLGDTDRVDRLMVRWPDGSVQEIEKIPVDTETVIRQER